MSLWLVRAGAHGEQEQRALQQNVAAIGWIALPDLSAIKSRAELKNLYKKVYPDAKTGRVTNHVSQIWAFINRIQSGDLVVLPLKHQSAIAIGEVTGAYQHRIDLGSDVLHVRPVKWVRTDIPRSEFAQDLLYSFGAFMTVCQIKRNNAEARVRGMLKGEPDTIGVGRQEPPIDIEQVARDQILEFLSRKFKGHDLARLVDAILKAQGYVTILSEPGPDGGVDILAGTGPMGFDIPRICVRVKSSPSPADVTTLRNLQGSIQTFGADQGLLVAWGGFKRSVLQEARRSFFTIRLWDSGNLVQSIFENYDRFPDDLKAELPLKKIWAHVLEEE